MTRTQQTKRVFTSEEELEDLKKNITISTKTKNS